MKDIDDVLGKPESHPSYGMLRVSRQSSTGGVDLFGCAVKPRETISIQVSDCVLRRHLNSDDYYSEGKIIEIEMSPLQYAEAISTAMNTTGVPCTLRFVRGRPRIPDPEPRGHRGMIHDEFREKLKGISANLDAMEARLAALMDKPSVTKAERSSLADMLKATRMEIESNMPFMLKQFDEHVDKAVSDGKAEVEAFALNHALRIAQEGFQLVDQGKRELPAIGVDIEPEGR